MRFRGPHVFPGAAPEKVITGPPDVHAETHSAAVVVNDEVNKKRARNSSFSDVMMRENRVVGSWQSRRSLIADAPHSAKILN